MSSTSKQVEDIEDIARRAHAGANVSDCFTGQFQAKQRIDITFPLDLLRTIDTECQAQNIARKDWIAAACAEKIARTPG